MSGSRIMFNQALAPIGHNAPEPWMSAVDIKPLMDGKTYHSDLYDKLFERLYRKAFSNVNKSNRW